MDKSTYQVTGRITTTDNNNGIHGLCVEVWDKNHCQDNFLGSDLSNSDGSFNVCFSASDFQQPYENNPEIYLIIKDCQCRIIHDTRNETCTCYPNQPWVLEIKLIPDMLWWHNDCGGSWSCPEDPLIPTKVTDEIEEAFELLNDTNNLNSRSIIECLKQTAPAIQCFDHIINDAWLTLQGDLDAASRYRDFLNVLCSEQKTVCGCTTTTGYSQFIDDVFEQAWAPTNLIEPCCETSDKEIIERSAAETECPTIDKESPCPCHDSIVDFDKKVILLMAALHISCRHLLTAKKYMLTLLEQFCRLESLGAIHRVATKALCGDQRSLSHFQDLVVLLRKRCDSETCCCETCLDEKLSACILDIVNAWASIDCYRVTGMKPARACPGDTVVICGNGFGKFSGNVVFRQKGGLDAGPRVATETWCDNRIDVTVPQGAGCGLTPLLPLDTIKVCNRYLEFRPTGCIEQEFEGSSAGILKFIVKDHINNECLLPGEPLKIRWKTCAADEIKIEIINRKTGAVISVQNPADERGCWDFINTNFTSTTEVLVRILVKGKCEPSTLSREIFFIYQRPPNLSVDGMEVTQAIQYYHANQHLNDAADRGPDNSLQLVTNKTAWIRVYLRSGQISGFDSGQLENVTGSIRVERRVAGIWNQVAVLSPENGPLSAQDSFVNYNAERGNIENTLNFVVSAIHMTGLLRFSVDLSSPYKQCPGNTATSQTTVDVNLTQTLNAAFITIGYNGPNNDNTNNLNLPTPTLAQCQAETSWAMTAFPVSGAPNVRIAGSFVTNAPLNDPRSCPGCCSPNWQPLLQQVASLVAADQAAFPGGNWVYYGIINNGIPVNVPGCNGWGATGGLAGRPTTYAHEIGHQFALPHARCGNSGTGNAAYPVYEPYDLPVDVPANPINTTTWTMASIGEYGLDINNGSIANPQNAEDFMSYCGPRWISLYTHNYLVNRPQLTPQVIATGSGATSERVIIDAEPGFTRDTQSLQPLIDILGFTDGESFTVSSVARLETRYLVRSGQATSFTAQLLLDGQIIASDSLYAFESEGCNPTPNEKSECDCDKNKPLYFRAMLDDVATGDTLRIIDHHGEVVWQRVCPNEIQALHRLNASIDKKTSFIKVAWKHKVDAQSTSEVWLRWSNDCGENWHALTVGLTENTILLDPENLPSGNLQFQIMAHDGFTTITETTETLKLEDKAPQVTILYPTDSSKVYTDRQLHLWGTASVFEGAEIPDNQYAWFLNNELIAQGRDVWVANPGSGNHEIRLEVTHGKKTGSTNTLLEIE